jgi:hypothetical protein
MHEVIDTGPQRKGRGPRGLDIDGGFGYGSKETSLPTGHVIRSVLSTAESTKLDANRTMVTKNNAHG